MTFIQRCREWQKNNPGWELWVGKYAEGAKDMFEEFGITRNYSFYFVIVVHFINPLLEVV